MSDIVILSDENKDWVSADAKNINFLEDNKHKTLFEKFNDYLIASQNINLKQKLIFYRLLSTMINAWISIIKSVKILQDQEKNKVFRSILWRFGEDLKSWKSLSECLEYYPKSFWQAEIWMIKAWEKTGKLNTILVDLADQIEKVASISWKIKWALMYPFFIILVVIWVISVMMTMVVPKLLEIFDSKDDLPGSTKLLISISDFFRDYWFVVIIIFVWFAVFISFWKKTPYWKYNIDLFLIKIPVFWEINKKLILSKFSRVFSWLISSWVSVVESLFIVSDAVWNDVYRQRILLLREDVKQWIKIWESLDGDKLFPIMMIQMIQVWEQTAKLDSTIVKIADFYDEQVDNTIWIINKLLEPFIIVFLAVVVWFIAVSIMQPIMNLSNTISNS